jgi:hypothetical protein
MMRALLPFLVASAAVSAVSHAQSAHFSVVANGEVVGHVIADHKGKTVDLDYAVSDNGRGPKHRERLTLSPSGMPIQWDIEGTSLMGGSVNEHMSWTGGVQSWSSQADKGEARAPAPQLYIADDASPWALGLYAQILRKAPQGTLNVLPAGSLSLRRVRRIEAATFGSPSALDAYVLTGVNLTPQFLLLDSHGLLFAVLAEPILVREGFEKHYQALRELDESLTYDLLEDLQKKIAHRYDVPVRVRNVHIFDPKSLSIGDAKSLVIFRGRITTLEAEPPDAQPVGDEVVIDGMGGTLVAGLHDMHSHNSMWSGPFYLAAGVTTTRDMGNNNRFLLDLMKHVDAGALPGPHMIPSGFLEGRSPYSARNGFIPDTLEEGLRDVNWYADRGYIQIKIYNSMNPAWVKPLASQAHALGLRVVGHIPAFTTPDRMIEDGYDEVTHINQLMLGWLLEPGEDTRTPLRLTAMARAADLDLSSPKVRHTVALMTARHTGLDTTAVIVERLMLSRAGQVEEGDAPYLDHVPIGYQRYRKRTFVPFKNEADLARYDKGFQKVMETLAMLHREGVPMWPGTDDTTGFTVHRELELYTQIGMTAAEALRVDTFDCDQYLRRDQSFGSLERGKHADFFLTVGDPTKNISAVREIRMVVKDGVIYYPEEIYRAMGIRPFASPPTLISQPGAVETNPAISGLPLPPAMRGVHSAHASHPVIVGHLDEDDE